MTLDYASLTHLFERYDGFLIDQFGVLMSGDGPYPGAAQALSELAKLGKPILILSNSGKRSEPNCARLVSNGFDRGDFITVLTSGEVAYHHIAKNLGISIPRGGKVLVLIRNGDAAPIDGLELVQTEDAAVADLLLIVSRDTEQTMASYTPLLTQLAERGVPCLCLNPDIKMLTPMGLKSAAGRLAEIYAELGGEVSWFGKPHSLIYETAIKMLGPLARDRILCIGDSLSHDIKGGQAAGCRTLLVRTGIHADLSDRDLAERTEALDACPDYYVGAFNL